MRYTGHFVRLPLASHLLTYGSAKVGKDRSNSFQTASDIEKSTPISPFRFNFVKDKVMEHDQGVIQNLEIKLGNGGSHVI